MAPARSALLILTIAFTSVLPACRSEAVSRARVPAARAHTPRTSRYDVDHYALEVVLHPDRRTIEGLCRVRLWPLGDLESVAFDFVGLQVLSATDGSGESLEFTHEAGILRVALGRPATVGEFVELELAYAGAPRRGLYFVGDRGQGPTHVFTQGECEDARYWFPCWDFPSDRATSELVVEMPSEWRAVAAGERIERVEVDPDRVRERWRMHAPHPTYLTTLVAGQLHVVEEEAEGLPLWYLAEPRYADWMGPCFERTPEMIAFFEQLTGRDYPYAKYSQACVDNFPLGGMENISATTLTDLALSDERGRRDYDASDLVAHETAHQWFGDLMTCRDWSHIWLNEGWATYAELLWLEHSSGTDAFRFALRDMQEQYLALDVGGNRRPIVHDVYREPHDLFSSGHAYPGAGARLHLLRFTLGDEAFFRGVRRYVSDCAGRGVVTDDFRRAMEAASGVDLALFFEQWFHRPGFPEFDVEWAYDEAARQVVVDIEQTQETEGGTPSVFRVPVEIEVCTAEGTQTSRVELERRHQLVRLPASERPLWVLFDVHGAIPKRLESRKSAAEWADIAREADDVNARRDALAVIGLLAERAADAELEGWTELLSEALEDPHAPVRLAAAAALARVWIAAEAREDPMRTVLARVASSDTSAAVRTFCLRALAEAEPVPELAELAAREMDAPLSWATRAAAVRLQCAARPAEAYDLLVRELGRDSPHDVYRASLMEVGASLDDERAAALIATWVADETASAEARAGAVRWSVPFVRSDAELRRTLGELLDTEHYHLRTAVIDALGAVGDTAARRALELYYPRCDDPSQRRRIEAYARLRGP